MPVTVDHGIHHVAYACRDLEATNRFYTELMGFELVHTEIKAIEGGYFRHVFYDTGAGGHAGLLRHPRRRRGGGVGLRDLDGQWPADLGEPHRLRR